jgi:hypothetical protein
MHPNQIFYPHTHFTYILLKPTQKKEIENPRKTQEFFSIVFLQSFPMFIKRAARELENKNWHSDAEIQIF